MCVLQYTCFEYNVCTHTFYSFLEGNGEIHPPSSKSYTNPLFPLTFKSLKESLPLAAHTFFTECQNKARQY